jgi:hypothetical protein
MLFRKNYHALSKKRLWKNVWMVKRAAIKELKKCGYIKSEKWGQRWLQSYCNFNSVVSPVQWESIYIEEYASTSFRKSKAQGSALGSMAAW